VGVVSDGGSYDGGGGDDAHGGGGGDRLLRALMNAQIWPLRGREAAAAEEVPIVQ